MEAGGVAWKKKEVKSDEDYAQELERNTRQAIQWQMEALVSPEADWSTLTDEETTVIVDRCNRIFKYLLTTPSGRIHEHGYTLSLKENVLDSVEEMDIDDGKFVLERYQEKGDLEFEKEFNMSKHKLIVMLMLGVWEEKNVVDISFMPACDTLNLDKATYHMVKIGLRRFISERNDGKAFVSMIQEAYISAVELSVYIILALAEAAKWPLKPVDWDSVKQEEGKLTIDDIKSFDTLMKSEGRRMWDSLSKEEKEGNEQLGECEEMVNEIRESKKASDEKMAVILETVSRLKDVEFEQLKSEHMRRRQERLDVLNSYTPPLPLYSPEELDQMAAEDKEKRDEADRSLLLQAQPFGILRDRLVLRKGQFCLARQDFSDYAFEEAQVIEQVSEVTYRVQFLNSEEFEAHEVDIGDIVNTEAPLYEREFTHSSYMGLRVAAFVETPRRGKLWCAGTIVARPNAVHQGDFLVFFDNSFEGYVEYRDLLNPASQGATEFRKSMSESREFKDGQDSVSWLRPIIEPMKIFPICRQTLTSDGKRVDKGRVFALIPYGERRRFVQRYFEKFPDWPLVTMKRPSPDRPPQAVSCIDFHNMRTTTAYCVHVDRNMCVLRFSASSNVPGYDCFTYPCPDNHKHNDEWVYRGSSRLNAVNLQTSDNSNLSARQKERNRKKFECATGEASRVLQTARKTNMGVGCEGGLLPGMKSAAELAAKAAAKCKANNFEIIPCTLPPLPVFPKIPHDECTNACLNGLDQNPSDKQFEGISPLTIPVLCGWNRTIYTYELDKPTARYRGPKEMVVYRAPCGATFSEYDTLNVFLKESNSRLTIDLFNFDAEIDILSRVVVDPRAILERDFTKGCELFAIPAVNTLDDDLPPKIIYGSRRFPFNTEVDISTINQNFCTGCDCDGDCSDAERCQCQRLTQSNVNRLARHIRPKAHGYDHRALVEKTISGIFECNENCSCNKRKCFNRVVQNDIKYPLQLFKTAGCGWGVRSVCDIPKGTFVANYVGALMTDAIADHSDFHGQDFYFADLDLNDVVENAKTQAYEVHGHLDLGIESDFEEESSGICSDEDSKVPHGDDSSDSEQEYGEVKRARRGSQEDGEEPRPTRRQQQMRRRLNDAERRRRDQATVPRLPQEIFKWSEYFDDKELYVIDAANKGNIGRFFNHSCDPNIETQHVLVDTHDLRLPWTAFFTVRNIKAGEELCWNYGYSPDAINENRQDGHQLYCECGSVKCQGRLL